MVVDLICLRLLLLACRDRMKVNDHLLPDVPQPPSDPSDPGAW